MCTQRSNRKTNARRRSSNSVVCACLLGAAVLAATPLAALALSTDKQQNTLINSDYAKMVQNKDNNAPGVTYLNGNVTMDQGTTKARGDEATVYQHPGDAKDADGKDISGNIQRVIMIGKKKQAHLEQLQDAGGLMTGNADKIDYNADTSVAVLTGNVVVVQPGRGTFQGAYMIYNTNTGEMESGDKASAGQRVQMVIEPKNKTPASAAAKPGATPPAAVPVPAATPSATDPKPAATPSTTEPKPTGGTR
jgi:lipopolysaccharide export system protein LptA